jgi:polyhydroxyalkanoate synthesis regulator protein
MAALEEQTQRNVAMFQQAMKMWAPFAAGLPGAMPGAVPPQTPADIDDSDKDEQLLLLRKQMEAMQKQLDAMARAKS